MLSHHNEPNRNTQHRLNKAEETKHALAHMIYNKQDKTEDNATTSTTHIITQTKLLAR